MINKKTTNTFYPDWFVNESRIKVVKLVDIPIRYTINGKAVYELRMDCKYFDRFDIISKSDKKGLVQLGGIYQVLEHPEMVKQGEWIYLVEAKTEYIPIDNDQCFVYIYAKSFSYNLNEEDKEAINKFIKESYYNLNNEKVVREEL